MDNPTIFQRSKITKKLFASTTLLLLILGVITPVMAFPYTANDDPISKALNHLRSFQQDDGSINGDVATSAWVVMAITAAGENPNTWKTGFDKPSIIDYLEKNADKLKSATDWERQLLAITAAGENPQSFGGINYVDRVKSFYNNGQMGNPTLLNDDFWGILALISAGERRDSKVVQDSKNYILKYQKTDGGWAFDVDATWGTDVDNTSIAIISLMAAGENPDSNAIKNALNFLKTNQTSDGGFQTWGATNSDSTSWAVWAIIATRGSPISSEWTKNGNTPISFLLSLQNPDGSFNWTPTDLGGWPQYTTANVIQALVGKPHPVRVIAIGGGVGGMDVALMLQLRSETQEIFASDGVESAYEYAVENGLITTEIPPILKGVINSVMYEALINQYGENLERYPSVEGRIQLLKALEIEPTQ